MHQPGITRGYFQQMAIDPVLSAAITQARIKYTQGNRLTETQYAAIMKTGNSITARINLTRFADEAGILPTSLLPEDE
jgi:hypothetical protein